MYNIYIYNVFIAKNVVIENTTFRLQIWDTAGQENFRAMTRIYYKNSSCALIVYDITEKESFNHIDSWITECKKIAPETALLVLIGNKNDLNENREVSYNEGLKLAEKNNMLFFETSAKNVENIEKIFKESVEYIFKNIKEGKYDLSDDACGIKICKNEKNINIDELDYESSVPKKKVTTKKKCC